LQQQQPPAHEKRSKIWIILITLWIINGSSFLAIKLTIDTIPPLLSAGIRFTIAGLILFSVYYIRGGYKRERITEQQWKHALILGLTFFFGGQGVLTWGAQYLSSGITGLLNSALGSNSRISNL
jgi:drug/metabolite transporter (DMT)-like permease